MNAGSGGARDPWSGNLDWQQIKDAIAAWTDLERDALHIYAALLAQVGSAMVLRRNLAHWGPWLAVLVLTVGGEMLDMYGDSLVEDWEFDAALHDLWNTMLLPTLLLILARFAPGLIAASPAAGPSEAADDA